METVIKNIVKNVFQMMIDRGYDNLKIKKEIYDIKEFYSKYITDSITNFDLEEKKFEREKHYIFKFIYNENNMVKVVLFKDNIGITPKDITDFFYEKESNYVVKRIIIIHNEKIPTGIYYQAAIIDEYFAYDDLKINRNKFIYNPKFTFIQNKDEITKILLEIKSKLKKLSRMNNDDPIVKYYGFTNSNIDILVKIERNDTINHLGSSFVTYKYLSSNVISQNYVEEENQEENQEEESEEETDEDLYEDEDGVQNIEIDGGEESE